jgi:acetyltransferase-like isoleucine patch superfamily enzyme
VHICAGVTIENACMISAHVVFTNDRYPRASVPGLRAPRSSGPTGRTSAAVVHQGVTIGANATIGAGLEIGEFAMIGMGSVVTRDVRPYCLVRGVPARFAGFVCRCGLPLTVERLAGAVHWFCRRCERRYRLEDCTLSLRA